MSRRYGLWLFTSPHPLADRRIWREDSDFYQSPTPFQTRIGIRYTFSDGRLLPNYKGMFGEFGPLGRPRSANQLFKSMFGGGFVSLRRSSLPAPLARATGFAVLWAPGIRFVSTRGAHLVAIALVRDEDGP